MAPNRGEAQILVVDDDEGLGLLMAGVLADEGHSVDVARSGSEALRRVATKLPELMLLDLKLNDMDGPLLVQKLREAGLEVPFVVVTGRGDEKVAVDIMKGGGLDYVMKDTGMLDLLPAVVRRALSGIEKDKALAEAQAEAQRLEREIVAISERERQNIGADLHDGLGQQLTAIELFCAGMRSDPAGMPKSQREGLEKIGAMLREAIGQTRLLARGLVPIGAGDDALPLALVELAEQVTSSGAVQCRVECEESGPPIPTSVASQLYRIVQEAVTNAIRHGHAKRIVIGLERADGKTVLQVKDNGKGMKDPRASVRGIGLRVMRHRAHTIGAEIEISSQKGAGTTVTCSLPDKR